MKMVIPSEELIITACFGAHPDEPGLRPFNKVEISKITGLAVSTVSETIKRMFEDPKYRGALKIMTPREDKRVKKLYYTTSSFTFTRIVDFLGKHHIILLPSEAVALLSLLDNKIFRGIYRVDLIRIQKGTSPPLRDTGETLERFIISKLASFYVMAKFDEKIREGWQIIRRVLKENPPKNVEELKSIALKIFDESPEEEKALFRRGFGQAKEMFSSNGIFLRNTDEKDFWLFTSAISLFEEDTMERIMRLVFGPGKIFLDQIAKALRMFSEVRKMIQ